MESTQRFFSILKEKRFIPLISDMLVEEISKAPQQLRNLLSDTIQEGVEQIQINEDIINLRDAYVNAGIITEKYGDDAMHVAIATFTRADVIASWNFRHLVNPIRIRAFNGINAMQSYGPIVILTPADLNPVLEEDNEQEEKKI